MTPWRLFLDEAQAGARNMAVDEAMLLAHARSLALPTLRFYSWKPHCLSLGRLQKQLPDAVLQGSADFDIVRRLTGGRAVWHAQEITYCAVVRAELLPPNSRSVAGAYAWLSAGFLRGLQDLGLPIAMAPGSAGINGPNCFATAANCDFLAGGKKLIGAAQCRKDETILQHGSLLLAIDEEEWRRSAGGPMDGATSLEALGGNLKAETVVEALCAGFALQAGTKWEPGGLSEQEEQMAQLLFREKYTASEWTFGAQLAEGSQDLIEQGLGNWGQSEEAT